MLRLAPAGLLALLVPALAAAAPCPDHDPLRRPFFGDLHVHTAFSHDAATQATRTLPADAYRFARGAALGIQPWDADGRPLRTVQLERPLDFAAVTDHAELLGEVHACVTPGAPGHDSIVCRIHRRWPRASFFVMNTHVARGTGSRMGFCGDGGEHCLDAALAPWTEIRTAARAANDACAFTAFVGYEWTASVVGDNLHRNVIFADDSVPSLPASYYEATSPPALWEALRSGCTEAGTGCDAIVIPHNSNLSAGRMFHLEEGIRAEDARRRARFESLIEVMQHKGDSECLGTPDAADEECLFEQLPFDTFRGRFVPFLEEPPRREDTTRHALGLGLLQQVRIGANPFKFGQIASTDTHLGTPGLVAEKGYPGHGGAGAPSPDALPERFPDDLFFNPGGLAVAWAEENTRASIFAALRRREVYGTSGPRLTVRLFAGRDLPADACQRPDFAALGYAHGVPMGGDLPPGEGAPALAVSALRDPLGAPLERIQIVKGWVEDGSARERVFDVAGGQGEGADALCRVWRDPDFDPDTPAWWYARVLQRPTPRWHTWVCRARGLDCSELAVPDTTRERAWTSPVWWTPASNADGSGWTGTASDGNALSGRAARATTQGSR